MNAGAISFADFPPFNFLSIFTSSDIVGGSILITRDGLVDKGGLKLGVSSSSFGGSDFVFILKWSLKLEPSDHIYYLFYRF